MSTLNTQIVQTNNCTSDFIASTIYEKQGLNMITYDEDKRLSNLQKHGFDFIGAESIFHSFHITYEDTSTPYGEQT